MEFRPMRRMAPHAFVRRVFACALALAGLLPLVAAAAPAITSATYDAGTGVLVVTGTDIPSLAGTGNDIVANRFTFTGDGGSTYTLTSTANVDIDSATGFTLTLGAADRAALNQRLNRQGTSSTIGTTYNLAAAEDWAAGADPAEVVADISGNGITVSNVPVPQITSASYDAATGILTVSGTGFLPLAGAGNDIVAHRFVIATRYGIYGGSTHPLNDTANVEIASATRFTLVLSATDKAGVDAIVDSNGTSSADGGTYLLMAMEDWNVGADGPVSIADTSGNDITASNVNIAPIVATSGGSAAFVAGDNTTPTPVAVDGSLTVSDVDSGTLASAIVAITGGFHAGQDVLAHTNDGATMGNINASYNAAAGVLTLVSAGAAATLGQWQSALGAVTYHNTAVTPDTATRTVAFSVVDGRGRGSNTASRSVTVTAVNQTPTVTTSGTTTSYGSGAPAVVIDGDVTVSDLDDATQSAATVAISGGFQAGDLLAFTNAGSSGNIAATYNAATGALTLVSTGATATNAQWSNALSSVTFASASTTGGNRTIAFSVSDGTGTSAVDTAIVAMLAQPAVTSVGSTSADGNYGPGDTIILTVTFDQSVVVNTDGGTPGLLMETGSADRVAEYGSGSGSGTLSFTYAVQAGDATGDLDYASTAALVLNGGTIRSAAGGDASPTLPAAGSAASIAGQHAIVIDTRATPVLVWIDALQKVLGEPAFDLPEPDSDSSGGFTFSSSETAVATVAGRTVTIVGPGTTTLLVTQEETGDHTEARTGITLTVTERPDPTRDPEVVGSIQAQVDASVRFAAAQQSNIQGRLRQLRAGRGNPSSNGLALSYIGRGGGMNLPLGTETITRRLLPAGVWTAGTITVGRRNPGNEFGELDFRSEGLTVGYDHGFGKNALLGVAGGYGWSDGDTGAASTLDGRQRSLMAYGLWRSERHGFVDGVLGIGSLDFDIVRWSEVVGANAQARRNGDQLFGSLTYGYEHTAEHLTLTSYGRYDASRTELDAYAENGLGLYDLDYGRQTVEDSGLAVGIEGRHHFATASVGYRPYWLVEYRNGLKNRSDLDINYVLYPVANDYVLGLQGSFDDVLSIGAGVDLDLPRGWQLSLLFQREQAGDNRADTYGLQLGWTSPGR